MRGRQRKYDKAIVLLEETLRIRIMNCGPDHHSVSTVLFSLGIMFDKRHEYHAAIRAYMDCLDIQRKIFGDDDESVAQTLTNIGIVQGNEGHLESAIECWEESIHIYHKGGTKNEDPKIKDLLKQIHDARKLLKDKETKKEMLI